MATLSSQKLNQFYELYSMKELSFNKSIISASGIEPKKVFLKIHGEQYPCVVYSCSMKLAKIIINLDTNAFEEIKRAKNFVNLRMSFFPKDLKSPVVFFVPAVVKGYNTFNAKAGAVNTAFLMSIEFTQKPPDDLIEILGKILESADNFEKRKSLRITLEGKVVDDIGFLSNKAVLTLDNIKRPCILRNVSSFGCMVVMSCNPKFILNKKTVITVATNISPAPLELEGTILRFEEVQGRKDLYGIGIELIEDKIPFEYKELLNSYLDKLEDMMKKKN
jgi:hypothetical protein